jgi:hypothetical protein
MRDSRRRLGVSTVIALGITGTMLLPRSGVAQESPRVDLELGESPAYRASETAGYPAGVVPWDIYVPATVSSDRECDELGYTSRRRNLFDGRVGLNRQEAGSEKRSGPIQRVEFGGPQVFGDPGEKVILSARAWCRIGAAVFSSAPVTKRFEIPSHSCEAGPLRVMSLRGSAWREDQNVINKRVPLYRGHFLITAYDAWLGRRGRVVFGAHECNGFTVALSGTADFSPGTYVRRGLGDPTWVDGDAHVLFNGDRHAGGIEMAQNGVVVPLQQPGVVRFRVDLSPPGGPRRSRVRVLHGAVAVAGWPRRSFVTVLTGQSLPCGARRAASAGLTPLLIDSASAKS